MASMKVKKRKKRSAVPVIAGICAAAALAVGCGIYVFSEVTAESDNAKDALAPINSISVTASTETEPAEAELLPGEAPAEETVVFRKPYKTENTREFDTNFVTAANSVLIDADSGEVLARHNSLSKIYPASMTKVMTLLVASEHLTESDMDKTVSMTYDMLAPLVADDASRAGFEVGEEVTVRDLLYGLVLPSGADGAVGLALYISGSEEEFVKLMNEKAEELGLTQTHFENTTGLHGEGHYTTCVEMAVIMKAAMDDPLSRELLSTYTYTTQPTEFHPEGITLYSTAFSRMYGTEVEGVVITSAKTGYTDQAAHCLVTYAEKGEHNYILVLAGDYEKYQAIYSSFYAYENYLP